MAMPPDAELEIFSYEDFGVGVRGLAEQLGARDWIPDTILGVVRGGLFVSTALAYALDIKDVRHVNVEFYTDAGETLPEPVLIGQLPYLVTELVAGPSLHDRLASVMFCADDVADIGARVAIALQALQILLR